MPKKFFDIIPPKQKESFLKVGKMPEKKKYPAEYIKSKDKTPPQYPEKSEITVERKIPERKPILKKVFSKKKIVFGLVFLVIVGITGHFIFAKTVVEIWPKTEILTLKETLSVESKAEQPDFSKKIIPGKVFEDKKSASQEFSSTGKVLKEEKAKGIIRVYNSYSTSAQSLLASTRFVSTEGKLFRSVKREIIPGGTYEKGKLVPGYIDIEVRAAEAGEDYNIGPSTFSIPGFAGTPKYTAFYGKSSESMAGGFKGEIPQVTAKDLERAKDNLVSRLEKESKDSLKTLIPKDFTLLDEAISHQIILSNPSAEVGAGVKSFNFQVEMKSEGLAFKKTDIDNFVKNLISSNIAKDKKFQEQSIQTNFSSQIKEPGKITLNLEIKAKIYPSLDLDEIKKALAGKSFQEVKTFLNDQPQITKIEVKSLPFWRKKIPDSLEKLEIIFSLD